MRAPALGGSGGEGLEIGVGACRKLGRHRHAFLDQLASGEVVGGSVHRLTASSRSLR